MLCVYSALGHQFLLYCAADESKFTSILPLLNFIAFIEKTVDGFCQCEST